MKGGTEQAVSGLAVVVLPVTDIFVVPNLHKNPAGVFAAAHLKARCSLSTRQHSISAMAHETERGRGML